MPEETEDTGRRQLNVSPSKRTLELLDEAVARFADRHENARQPSRAAADILNKFIEVWIDWMEQQDKALQIRQEELKARRG